MERVDNGPIALAAITRGILYVVFPSLSASPNTRATLQMYVESVVMLPGFVPLFLLILSPSWLALPIFWLYAVLSILIILYVVLPQRAWGWMKTRTKLLWKRIFAATLY